MKNDIVQASDTDRQRGEKRIEYRRMGDRIADASGTKPGKNFCREARQRGEKRIFQFKVQLTYLRVRTDIRGGLIPRPGLKTREQSVRWSPCAPARNMCKARAAALGHIDLGTQPPGSIFFKRYHQRDRHRAGINGRKLCRIHHIHRI